MEQESKSNIAEKEQLNKLADELDVLQQQKRGEQGDIIIQKLIQRLRSGDAYAAKVFCGNEADKFTAYRNDGIPLIIEKLYGGSGSPWFTVERQLQSQQRNKGTQSR